MTDSPRRLPDLLPVPVADSPAYRRLRRDLEGLTPGQLQDLKVRYCGVVQRALHGVAVTPFRSGESDGAA